MMNELQEIRGGQDKPISVSIIIIIKGQASTTIRSFSKFPADKYVIIVSLQLSKQVYDIYVLNWFFWHHGLWFM